MSQGQRTRWPALARWTIEGIAVVLAIWFVASAVLLYQARSHALDGLDALDSARGQLSAQSLLRGEGVDSLDAAVGDFAAAHAKANASILAPWSAVPILGQNVRSVERLTAAATEVARIGTEAARASAAALATPTAQPADRLALLDRLGTIVTDAESRLQDIDLGPDLFLVGPLGDARQQFLSRYNELGQALRDAVAAIAGVRHLLAGPRNYLVVAANNAEMRAGSGMFLSAGVAHFAGGAFTIGTMRPTPEFNLPAGAVAVPDDFAHLWGWIHPTQEWRNLATTPRFNVTAPLAAKMWAAATGQSVDGVLVVDPDALGALLSAQGPIQVNGQTLSADSLVQFLLLGQYQGLGNQSPDLAARYDQLSVVAGTAVASLQSRPWNLSGLIGSLAGVGKGRHILAWSADRVEEQAWRAAGVDGALVGNSLAINVLNVGANKLDQFLAVDASMSVESVAGGGHEVRIALRLENKAPTGLPAYVEGPGAVAGLAAGEYQGIVEINAPGVGSQPIFTGISPTLVAGDDGPTKATAVGFFRLTRGATLRATIRFRLPKGLNTVRVEASGRIPPLTWHFAGQTWTDGQPERVEW